MVLYGIWFKKLGLGDEDSGGRGASRCSGSSGRGLLGVEKGRIVGIYSCLIKLLAHSSCACVSMISFLTEVSSPKMALSYSDSRMKSLLS